ncbi:MAG: carbon-nitrogen hydrolase [Candidatus Kapabacteria bacterium]|nr:carbon-nitrogen hydrolase [Candidatus Kapabacteria bacterium]
MKIATVQIAPIFGEKEHNLNTIINLINNTECDLIIFPELCTTGYSFADRNETEQYAESSKGDTISILSKMAMEQNKIIILGFAEKDDHQLFNSAAALFPDQNLNRIYRKSHLFYREKFCFDPGDTGFFVINNHDLDVNIGLMICYDWRFPEAARSLGLLGADLIVCPSNLVTDVWHISMPSRALENKVYLACVNRFGTENRNGESLLFKGKSAIYDYNGKILAEAAPDAEQILFADIDPIKTRDKSFNPFNDIFKDRRTDLYHNNSIEIIS